MPEIASFFPFIVGGLFIFAILTIVFEFFDSVTVLIGSTLLMLLLKIISPADILSFIDWKTILLLTGMMIVVEVTRESNLLAWMNVKIAQLTKGNPLKLGFLFSIITLILSTFLANATTMLVIVPITIALTRGIGLDPKPFLIMEIIFSDIGGALTVIGDPTNVMIASANNFSFVEFLAHQIYPITAVSITLFGLLTWKYWSTLRPIHRSLPKLFMNHLLMAKINHEFSVQKLNFRFIIQTSVVLGLTLAFFVFDFFQLPLPLIALLSASAMLVINHRFIITHEIFKRIDWHLILFFVGLFIHVGALEKSGALEPVSEFIKIHATSTRELSLYVLWIIGLLSAFIENIPLVAMMIPVLQSVLGTGSLTGNTDIVWYALSLGSCIGGNGSLIGSSANMIVVKCAQRDGIKLSFLEYFKIGYPITILSLVICSIFILLATHAG